MADWEDVNKHARRLQSQLDSKLNEYEIFVAKLGAPGSGGSPGSTSADNVDHDVLSADINRLLEQFAAVGQRVAAVGERVAAVGGGCKAVSSAECTQRSSSIQEAIAHFSKEFHRKQRIYRHNVNRSRLFGDLAVSSPENGGLRPRAGEQLVREQKSIYQSINIVDDLIGTASATSRSMEDQKTRLSNITREMNMVMTRFPALNQMITQISRHKNRDMIVLSIVIASCMAFTVVYKMTQR